MVRLSTQFSSPAHCGKQSGVSGDSPPECWLTRGLTHGTCAGPHLPRPELPRSHSTPTAYAPQGTSLSGRSAPLREPAQKPFHAGRQGEEHGGLLHRRSAQHDPQASHRGQPVRHVRAGLYREGKTARAGRSCERSPVSLLKGSPGKAGGWALTRPHVIQRVMPTRHKVNIFRPEES